MSLIALGIMQHKAEQQKELESQKEEYFSRGGVVEKVPYAATGDMYLSITAKQELAKKNMQSQRNTK
jgi:hypothetical protein